MKFLLSLILIFLGIGIVQDRPDLINRLKHDIKIGTKVIEKKLSGLAPLPGSLTEGTSTAGWTDDGSIVRLNTQADNVGIGTVNPSMKLQVQGNSYVTGNLSLSGGTINFSNGPATTSIYVNSTGIGFGSSSPNAPYAFSNGLMVPGTTTLDTLVLASTTIQIRGLKYTLPVGDGSNGQFLSTNGQGGLSFASTSATTATSFSASGTPANLFTLNRVDYSFPATQGASSSVLVNNGSGAQVWYGPEWELLGNCQVSVATTSCTFMSIPSRKNYMITWEVIGKSATSRMQMKFPQVPPSTSSYGWTIMKNGAAAATATGDTQCDILDTNDTVAEYSQIWISNSAAGNRKLVNFQANRATAGSAAPDVIRGACTWNDTTGVINHIQLRLSDNATQSAGSHSLLFGSRY